MALPVCSARCEIVLAANVLCLFVLNRLQFGTVGDTMTKSTAVRTADLTYTQSVSMSTVASNRQEIAVSAYNSERKTRCKNTKERQFIQDDLQLQVTRETAK